MSNTTEQVRSTRADARAFAEAFASADDAFTFGAAVQQSRTITLDELGEAIALPHRAAPADRPAADRDGAADRDRLLTLDELSDALARPLPAAGVAGDSAVDGVDFDFGTSTHERARRRTAARLEGDPAAHGARRRSAGSRDRDQMTPAARRRTSPRDDAPAAREAMAAAAVAAAERLADPQGSGRFARDRVPAAATQPVAAPPPPRQPPAAAQALREIGRRADAPHVAMERFRANPDRIAMWAVLLGILLVLIAVTSDSGSALAVPLLSAR